jgi:hypothetical protein
MASPFGDRMWCNDRSLADFKVLTADPKGFSDPPSSQDRIVPVVGRLGGLRVSNEGETPSRHFSVEAGMFATSDSEALTLRDAMLKWLTAYEVEVRFAAWPDRIGYARYESISEEYHPGMYRSWKFTMNFVMPDPLKYNRQVDIYTIPSGSEVPLVLGTAASDVRLQLIGLGVASPRVLYKDVQGLIRGDISFAFTPVTNNWIDYNWDSYQLAKKTFVPFGLTSVDVGDVPEMVPTRLFVADPNDGDEVMGPTLTAINCNLVASLRRAWL